MLHVKCEPCFFEVGVEKNQSEILCFFVGFAFVLAYPITVSAHPITVLAHPITVLAHPITVLAHPIIVLAHPAAVSVVPSGGIAVLSLCDRCSRYIRQLSDIFLTAVARNRKNKLGR